MATKQRVSVGDGTKTTFPQVTDYACCYGDCPEPGTIHIGINGGGSHWICWHHLERWNARRARFIRDGKGCAMQELGEPRCDECGDEVAKDGVHS
jgi:hypothetical protein